MAKLRERIDALEAKAPAVQQEQDAALRAFRAKAERRLLEKIEDARAGRDRYAELDAAGRVRHWQKRIPDGSAFQQADIEGAAMCIKPPSISTLKN